MGPVYKMKRLFSKSKQNLASKERLEDITSSRSNMDDGASSTSSLVTGETPIWSNSTQMQIETIPTRRTLYQIPEEPYAFAVENAVASQPDVGDIFEEAIGGEAEPTAGELGQPPLREISNFNDNIDIGDFKGFSIEKLRGRENYDDLLNVIPKGRNQRSANERWNRDLRKVDLRRLRIFGEEGYALVPKEKRKKLEPKSRRCRFLGYEGPNYRIWDIEKKCVKIARDVIFLGDEVRTSTQENGELNLMSVNQNENCIEAIEVGAVMKMDEKEPENHRDTSSTKNDDADDENFEMALTLGGLRQRQVPVTYNEAVVDDDWDKWKTAMDAEYNSLMENKTWNLVDLPPEKKPIRCKWVFALKRDVDGNILKYKARLVAKGYSQKEGIDYEETFAPVVKYTSVRILLAIAANLKLQITQLDAVTAFFNGVLQEEVYMVQPEGYSEGSKKCCSAETEEQVRNTLSSRFKMKHMGVASSILGIRIEKDEISQTISIDQSRYINDILERFNMIECNSVLTPLVLGEKISKEYEAKTEKEKWEMRKIPYREAIGSLLFLAITTRPDLFHGKCIK